MFSLNIIRNVFRKTPMNLLQPIRRNLTKKNSSTGDIFSRLDSPPDFEKFQNAKITPKGYKVIYITPLFWVTLCCYSVLPVFWGIICYDLYNYYTDENYIEKIRKKIKNFSVRDKMMQVGLIVGLVILMQILPTRVVIASFRKGDEFQTLRFGLLGPLTKKYVHHGPQAMEPTKQRGIYSLNGTKVMVLSSGFRNYEDFSSVIKYDME